jgi:sortase (surface protein transpeptidase)
MRLGELPTSGGLRPGPIGFWPPKPPVIWHGARPVAIRIPVIQVDTDIELGLIIDGVLQDPTGPYVVTWYRETSRVGVTGNVVLSGHVDYWNVGPAVFYHLGDLAENDRIEITGNNGEVFRYDVSWNRLYDAATAPVMKIAGKSKDEVLTLITCGGTFDPTSGEYEQRRVVRAARSK